MKKKGKPQAVAAPAAPSFLNSILVAPAVITVCVLLFYWTPITSPSASIQWDAADMHYPLQKYFSDQLLSGKIPFWTPYLFAGFPFLANPEAAGWYVPHWIFFLTGVTPLSIQLELALHALLACAGAYLLLVKLGTSHSAATLGAFAYGLSGFFAGNSSHVGLFSAAAWFPWLLLAYRFAIAEAPLRFAALGGVVGGLMILAGYFQTALYGFLGLGLFALADWRMEARRLVRMVAILGGMLAGAIGIAAIEILPALELTGHSIRANLDYANSTESVLHSEPLLTLVSPDILGAISGNYHGPSDITQYYFYAGLLAVPLAILGAIKSRMRVLALAILIPSAWYMCGPAGGLYRLAVLLPGMRKVRAPIQGWFLVALGLALLAAAGADWIFTRWQSQYLKIALIAVLFADVWYWNSINNPLAYARGSFESLYGAHEQTARIQVAATQTPLTRFDAPRGLSAMGPLDHPLDLKLETTYGYFSLEPALYDEYTDAMTRNAKLRDGLNVSRVLNTKTGALETNSSMAPRAYFPKAVSDMANDSESKRALGTLDPAAQSIVLAPHPAIQQDTAATATVSSSDEQSYRVRYHAASPSLLKLSVAWYPGWQATLAGRDLPVLRVDHALMGVVAPAGDGEVEFRFHSTYFTTGLAITAVTALAIIALAWRGVQG